MQQLRASFQLDQKLGVCLLCNSWHRPSYIFWQMDIEPPQVAGYAFCAGFGNETWSLQERLGGTNEIREREAKIGEDNATTK